MEFSEAEFVDPQKMEIWYVRTILEQVRRKNITGVLIQLNKALSADVNILESEIPTGDLFLNRDISEILKDFIEESIRDGSISTEQRAKYYKYYINRQEHEIASWFIEYIEPREGENKFSINPWDLQRLQQEHYEWLVDHKEDVHFLHDLLENDGHLHDEAEYDLPDELKKKIVDYVKKEMALKTGLEIAEERSIYEEIINVLGGRD